MRNSFAFAIIACVFFSCSSDSGSDSKGSIGNNDSLVQADSAHLFIMPTPLQVATFLHNNAQLQHEEFLSDKTNAVDIYGTDYKRAMNFGVCIADAGYAAMFGNRQLALDYLARCEELVKKLRIEPAAAPFLVRIKSNIDNRDSLSYLLLSMYDNVQKNLNENKREKTAYYIVSGCYMENLAITLQYGNNHPNAAYLQLIAQQKMWLNNLQEACTYLEPDSSTQDLYNTFYTLQEYSKEIVVETRDDNKLTCSYPADALMKLREKCLQLRNEITAPSGA